jgi:hypothetical protein
MTFKIELKIIEARNLKGGDFAGLNSDPFCKVITSQSTQQTHVCKKTRNPIWNHDFTLFTNDNETIRFEVYDYDRFGKNDFLGSASYRIIGPNVNNNYIDTWLSLSKKGEIHITLNVINSMYNCYMRSNNQPNIQYNPRHNLNIPKPPQLYQSPNIPQQPQLYNPQYNPQYNPNILPQPQLYQSPNIPQPQLYQSPNILPQPQLYNPQYNPWTYQYNHHEFQGHSYVPSTHVLKPNY